MFIDGLLQFYDRGMIVIFIVQIGNQKFREVKKFVQGYKVSK